MATRFLLAAVALVALSWPELAVAQIGTTILSIGDGDTIRVRQGGKVLTVRLACIDAPETAQSPYGQQARCQNPPAAATGVLIGFTEAVAIHNDPNGEADLVAGGYTANTNGAGQHYSWKNWQPRWEADGPGTGWLLSCHP